MKLNFISPSIRLMNGFAIFLHLFKINQTSNVYANGSIPIE